MANLLKYVGVAFKGACMGAADVIPGVSGGTIAFLMGIYQELLDSIKSVNGEAFKLLFKGKIAEFWKHINGNFLASLFVGILVSVFSLARLMKYLLEFHPIPLWSFFFGLILASAIYILKGLDKWSIQNIIALLIGVGIGAVIHNWIPEDLIVSVLGDKNPFGDCNSVGLCGNVRARFISKSEPVRGAIEIGTTQFVIDM